MMSTKNRERLKNLLLAGSILLSLLLVAQLWFGKYFMPGGASDMLNALDRGIRQPVLRFLGIAPEDELEFSDSFRTVMKAKRIIVNSTGSRQVVTEENAGYASLYNTIQDMTADILTDRSLLAAADVADPSEWLSALKANSVYVDYGVVADSRLLSVAMGGTESNAFTEDIAVMRDYILVLGDAASNKITMLVKDYETGEIHRYMVNRSNNELRSEIGALAGVVDVNAPSYAFELNLHQETAEDGSNARVVFDPLILVSIYGSERAAVQKENLLGFEGEDAFSAETEARILRLFGINANTMRQYVDVSGSRVYVENYANLEIRPDGLLEYKVLPGNKGLKLAREDKAAYSVYDTVNQGVSFLRSINAALPKDQFSRLRVSSRLTESSMKDGVYTLTLDYYADGIPIVYREDGGVGHSVVMEIENGYLKAYRHHFHYFEKTGDNTVAEPMISAVDKFVEAQPAGNLIRLDDAFLGYVDAGNGLFEQKWCLAVAGDNTYRIVE